MSEYISREAFLAEQRHLYCENCARRKNGKGKFVYDIGDAPCRACDIMDVLDAVEDFPAADVRPVVRGEWEKTEGFDEYGGGRYVEWTCSVCFSKAKGGWDVRDKHIDEPPYWNYCPNCGADMREES